MQSPQSGQSLLNLSQLETQLLRQLVLVQGRDATGFAASVLPDGCCISVRSPAAAAFYPLEGWTSRFLRHLHHGYFDPKAVTRPVRPAN
ncbi:hypothetical protein EZ313_22880 [Ramlibacter henchirensis]|uniref:Uncharacterized protein n=1 Tax=Ramlibacter henchirensis TaxID=204072 RepID=A0A4Z0BJ97_9BURK|nr:hypothetical protein [Ramlibacter henchirensis]TFY99395.1 hypothetical protein EZ313_22880 [Ramlibacter henchirensis]